MGHRARCNAKSQLPSSSEVSEQRYIIATTATIVRRRTWLSTLRDPYNRSYLVSAFSLLVSVFILSIASVYRFYHRLFGIFIESKDLAISSTSRISYHTYSFTLIVRTKQPCIREIRLKRLRDRSLLFFRLLIGLDSKPKRKYVRTRKISPMYVLFVNIRNGDRTNYIQFKWVGLDVDISNEIWWLPKVVFEGMRYAGGVEKPVVRAAADAWFFYSPVT